MLFLVLAFFDGAFFAGFFLVTFFLLAAFLEAAGFLADFLTKYAGDSTFYGKETKQPSSLYKQTHLVLDKKTAKSS